MTTAVSLAQSVAPGVSLGFKNRIINGGMTIDQRNAGASVTGNDSVFPVDRWRFATSQSGKLTAQQNQGGITPPAGFTNYVGVTVSSAITPSANDYFAFFQPIEGYNMSDFGWGTANAKAVALSFWARSSVAGTFGISFWNNAGSRFYTMTYSLPVANTWTYCSITVPGDTSGTWETTNGRGLAVYFGLGVGSNYSAAPGAWTSSTGYGASGATTIMGTAGATWQITGVQLEVGTTATPFEFRDYGRELIMCQRYFNITNPTNSTSIGFGCAAGSLFGSTVAALYYAFPVRMRSAPTVTRGGAQDTFWRSGGSGTDTATVIGGFSTSVNNLAFEINSLTNPGAVGYPIIYNGQLSISAEL